MFSKFRSKPDDDGYEPDVADLTDDEPTATAPTTADQIVASSFGARCEKIVALGKPVIQGKDGWLFSTAEIGALAKSEKLGEEGFAKVVDCIVDYDIQLKSAGIELVLAPIPPKAAVYHEQLGSGSSGRVDRGYLALYNKLRANGVTVVDLLPPLRRDRMDRNGLMFPKTSSYLSSRGAQTGANAIYGKLKSSRWRSAMAVDSNMATEVTSLSLLGDLGVSVRGEGAQLAPEISSMRAVGRRDTTGLITQLPSANSGTSVVLVTDKNGTVYAAKDSVPGFPGTQRGSMRDQLAFEFGTQIDLYTHPTSGGNTARIRMLRKALSQPKMFENLKAVVWSFSATEFTSGDWKKVPLQLKLRRDEEGLQ